MTVENTEKLPLSKVPIWRAVRTGYGDTFGNFGALITAAAIPLLLSILLAAAIPEDETDVGTTLLRDFLDAVPIALFELVWLRFLLLRRTADRPHLLPRPGQRFPSYVGYSLLLTGLLTSVTVLETVSQLIAGMPSIIPDIGIPVLLFLSGYLTARLGFVLLWLAIDQPGRLVASWQVTRGNGFRILWVILVALVPFLIVIVIGGFLWAAIDPNAAALMETNAYREEFFWTTILIEQVVIYLFVAISAGALAEAFRSLTGWTGDQQEILERFE